MEDDWGNDTGFDQPVSYTSTTSKSNTSYGGGDDQYSGGKSYGGGSDKSCYKCGESGHLARECPEAQKQSGGNSFGGKGFGDSENDSKWGGSGKSSNYSDARGGSGSGGRSCYKCGEEGHMSRECPQNEGGGGGSGRSSGCFKCGEDGHMARDCTAEGSSGGRSNKCYKCNEEGHMARDCTAEGVEGGRSNKCFKCGEEGHMARDCTAEGGTAEGDDKPRPTYVPPPPPEDESMYSSMKQGIHFGKYDSIPVEVTGVNAPKPIATFAAANLPEKMLSNVAKSGYERPTPVQKYGISIINNDRDMMACAQTGSGKTAAFLLPVLASIVRTGCASSEFSDQQKPQAIVVGPTRELVYQIYLEARKFSNGTVVRPVVAYGGTSTGHQIRELMRGCHMLIATPGRLMDFINRGKVSLESVQYLILDEADRMLDMGFESEMRTLVNSPGMPAKANRHTLMFSATFPDEIQKLAHEFLQEDFLFLTVGRVGGACSDVEQVVLQVDQMDKRDKLVELLADVKVTRARTLVFVETKRNADFLACFLSQTEFPTTSIHGDRLQQQREEALRDFKTAECPVLVATSVAARGLDIPDVEHVINYDLPKEIDEYVHRIGRTGRCGNVGKSTSFYDQSKDFELARSLVKVLSDASQEVPTWLEEGADSAIGTGFGGGATFASKDTRQTGRRGGGGGFESRSRSDYDYNDGGGFGGGAAADDESWD